MEHPPDAPTADPVIDYPIDTEGTEPRKDYIEALEINAHPHDATVTFSDLNLSEANPTSPAIRITVEKTPITTVIGERYADVYFDGTENDTTRYLAGQATALQTLPEEQRPRRVLELLRGSVQYAYPGVVKELQASDPELGAWVAANVSTNRQGAPPVKLSDVLQSGYGVCSHLAPAYLWLAEKAGLEGGIFTSDTGVITNVLNPETGQPLFKSTDVGQPAEAHAWAEIRLSNGQWIPVDPSTGIIGDDQPGRNTFAAAGYKSYANAQLDISTSVPKELEVKALAPVLNAGEPGGSTVAQLRLRSTMPRLRIGKAPLPPSNQPYQGSAAMHISTPSGAERNEGSFGLVLNEVIAA